ARSLRSSADSPAAPPASPRGPGGCAGDAGAVLTAGSTAPGARFPGPAVLRLRCSARRKSLRVLDEPMAEPRADARQTVHQQPGLAAAGEPVRGARVPHELYRHVQLLECHEPLLSIRDRRPIVVL